MRRFVVLKLESTFCLPNFSAADFPDFWSEVTLWVFKDQFLRKNISILSIEISSRWKINEWNMMVCFRWWFSGNFTDFGEFFKVPQSPFRIRWFLWGGEVAFHVLAAGARSIAPETWLNSWSHFLVYSRWGWRCRGKGEMMADQLRMIGGLNINGRTCRSLYRFTENAFVHDI